MSLYLVQRVEKNVAGNTSIKVVPCDSKLKFPLHMTFKHAQMVNTSEALEFSDQGL